MSRDHACHEIFSRGRAKAPDQRHSPYAPAHVRSARESVRTAARHSDDSEALQLEVVRELPHIGAPSTDGAARLECRFTETRTIRRQQAHMASRSRARCETGFQARARVAVKIDHASARWVANFQARKSPAIRELQAVLYFHGQYAFMHRALCSSASLDR
jgi:hypothetical protein